MHVRMSHGAMLVVEMICRLVVLLGEEIDCIYTLYLLSKRWTDRVKQSARYPP